MLKCSTTEMLNICFAFALLILATGGFFLTKTSILS